MTQPDPLFKIANELRTLVEKLCNTALSEQESVRLNQLLREGDEARSFYLAYLAIHARLAWEFGPRVPTQSVDVFSDFAKELPAPARRSTLGRRRFRRAWAVAGSAAVVAVLLIGFFLANRNPEVADVAQPPLGSPAPSESLEQVATLSGCHDGQWADPGDSVEVDAALPPGRLNLLAGIVEITFADGAVVLLEGPAEFETLDASRGFLHHGQAVVRVSQQARGFVLATRDVDVLDLGTEFAVRVERSGKTEILVLEGSVVAQMSDAGEGTTVKRSIEAGEAMAVDVQADLPVQEIPYAPERYVRKLPAPPQLANVTKPLANVAEPLANIARPLADVAKPSPDERVIDTASAAMPEGPVLLLTFDDDTVIEKDGRYTFKDRSGNGNDAQTDGAKWTADGISGGACEFDGQDDYIDCGHSDSFNIKGPMTISLWLNLQKWDKGGGICTKGTGEGGESWLLDVYDNNIRFVRRPASEGDYRSVRAKESVTPGKWYHVVAIADGQRLRLFIDLEETIGDAYAEESLINDHVVTIGSRQADEGPYDANVSGVIDEVAVWPRALTTEEVRMLFERVERNKGLQ